MQEVASDTRHKHICSFQVTVLIHLTEHFSVLWLHVPTFILYLLLQRENGVGFEPISSFHDPRVLIEFPEKTPLTHAELAEENVVLGQVLQLGASHEI